MLTYLHTHEEERVLMKTAISTATYYPLKKQRSEIDPPSTATTDCGDEKDFSGPKFFSGRAAHTGLTVDIQ